MHREMATNCLIDGERMLNEYKSKRGRVNTYQLFNHLRHGLTKDKDQRIYSENVDNDRTCDFGGFFAELC